MTRPRAGGRNHLETVHRYARTRRDPVGTYRFQNVPRNTYRARARAKLEPLKAVRHRISDNL